MSQQAVIDKKLVVKSMAHDGYRRAGMSFYTGENILEPNTITCAQLAMLEADLLLSVSSAEGSLAEANTADGTAGNVVQGSEHDGLTRKKKEK